MRRILSIAALSVLVFSATAGAQRGSSTAASSSAKTPIELGLDAGLSFGMGGQNNTTLFNLNLSQIRVGFLMSPQFSLEPSVGLSSRSTSGVSNSVYMLGLGGLYHFSAARTQNQYYLRPFVNYIGSRDKTTSTVGTTTTTTTTSSSVTEMGGGLGIKIPYQDRMAWRLEANMSHFSKQYLNSDNRLGMLFGFSYFTR
jgi:hypothetical protein